MPGNEEKGMRQTLSFKNRFYLAVIAGLLATVILCRPAVGESATVKAWWGAMYPAYCFSEKPQKDEGGQGQPVKIKYTFRFLKHADGVRYAD